MRGDNVLRLSVGGQLRDVNHRGAAHRCDAAAPQRRHAFLLHDADEGVYHVLVVASLVSF